MFDLSELDVGALLKEMKDTYGHLSKYHTAKTYLERLSALRVFYLHNYQRIVDADPQRFALGIYPIDWTLLFTPIETDAWNSIRSKGRMALYPQFPALKYIIDFANPKLKIGLELDGKDYHDHDKDLARDTELSKEGWRIYRITGSKMVKRIFKDFADCAEEGLSDEDTREAISTWLMDTGDGVIHAIGTIHFWERNYPDWFYSDCELTLRKHQLIQ